MRALSVGISPVRLAIGFAGVMGLACMLAAVSHADDGGSSSPPDGGASPDGADVPDGADETPSAPFGIILTETRIEGYLLEKPLTIARFLGLEPGSRYAASEQIALPDSLERIGYTLDGPPVLDGTRLLVHLTPLKVVRSIRVKHNFPLFDDEVIRHLSFTSGSLVPSSTGGPSRV